MLTLRYSPMDQWYGKVRATVASEGFEGTASAWFSKEDLTAFAGRMSECPLKDQPLNMDGGNNPGSGERDRHLEVGKPRPAARASTRGVVELAPPDRGQDDLGTYSLVRTWFPVTYTDLERFQRGLRKMLRGQAGEATLTGCR